MKTQGSAEAGRSLNLRPAWYKGSSRTARDMERHSVSKNNNKKKKEKKKKQEEENKRRRKEEEEERGKKGGREREGEGERGKRRPVLKKADP